MAERVAVKQVLTGADADGRLLACRELPIRRADLPAEQRASAWTATSWKHQATATGQDTGTGSPGAAELVCCLDRLHDMATPSERKPMCGTRWPMTAPGYSSNRSPGTRPRTPTTRWAGSSSPAPRSSAPLGPRSPRAPRPRQPGGRGPVAATPRRGGHDRRPARRGRTVQPRPRGTPPTNPTDCAGIPPAQPPW